MFEIEYGQHWDENTPEIESRTVHPEKVHSPFYGIPMGSMWSNTSSESFIQSVMVRQWKFGPLG
jgi:hypothetical protein